MPWLTEPRGALVQRLINGTPVNIIRIDRVSDVRGYLWANNAWCRFERRARGLRDRRWLIN